MLGTDCATDDAPAPPKRTIFPPIPNPEPSLKDFPMDGLNTSRSARTAAAVTLIVMISSFDMGFPLLSFGR